MSSKEYKKTEISMWYNPSSINGGNAGIVEITGINPDQMRVYFKADPDRGNLSEYLTLDEAENLALNMLAMITDVRRNGYGKRQPE